MTNDHSNHSHSSSPGKGTLRRTSALLAASAIAISALALSPQLPSNPLTLSAAMAEPVSVDAPRAPGFADVVEAVSPAVVSVRVEQEISPVSDSRSYRFDRRPGREDDLPDFFREHPEFFKRFFGEREGRGQGKRRFGMSQGSGFFISEDGFLVTNNHVIEGGSSFKIVMDDGTEYPAELVGADERSDLAVLKVEAEREFVHVAFSDEEPRIGDWVVAVGNPFGLGGTVTAGIVSARGREIGANRYDDFIQIDAAVNKGNSGGPAFDLGGKVIGVNTAIFSPSGGNVGIAFAIPAATARDIVGELMQNGSVVRGWLGVQIQPVTPDIAEALGLDDARGAIVSESQDDSPASRAGIRSGDIIRSVDGKSIRGPRELARVIAAYDPEARVEVGLFRDGNAESVEVTLGTLPVASNASLQRDGGGSRETGPRIGLALGMADDGEGVVVLDIEPGSPADRKGIEPGDVITGVNGESVSEPADVGRLVREVAEEGRKSALLQIRRNGETRFVAVPLQRG